MTNPVKLFADELTNWLINESGFNQSKYQISLYYKYAPDGFNLIVLSYVDDYVYWYTYEEPGTWFVDTLGNILRVKLLGYANWFIYIGISQLKDNNISVYQYIYMLHMLLQNI